MYLEGKSVDLLKLIYVGGYVFVFFLSSVNLSDFILVANERKPDNVCVDIYRYLYLYMYRYIYILLMVYLKINF